MSHNLATIQALCQRGIVLEGGRPIADAPTTEAVDQYLRTLERAAEENLLERADRDNRGYQETRIGHVEVRQAGGSLTSTVVGGRAARIIVGITDVIPELECRIMIVNSLGQPIATLDSEVRSQADERDPALGTTIECELDALPLLPGRYRLDVLVSGRSHIQDGLQAAGFFDVEPGTMEDRPMPAAGADGDVALNHRWRLPT